MNSAAAECGQDFWEMIDEFMDNYHPPKIHHTMTYSNVPVVKLGSSELPFWSLQLGSQS